MSRTCRHIPKAAHLSVRSILRVQAGNGRELTKDNR